MKRVCGFAVSHIVTHYYASSHRVAWSVGMSVALSVCHTSEPCKTAETIIIIIIIIIIIRFVKRQICQKTSVAVKLPFAFSTGLGPMNNVLHDV